MRRGRPVALALAVLAAASAGAARAEPPPGVPSASPGAANATKGDRPSRGVIVPRRRDPDPAMPVVRPKTESRMPVIRPPASTRDGDKIVVPR